MQNLARRLTHRAYRHNMRRGPAVLHLGAARGGQEAAGEGVDGDWELFRDWCAAIGLDPAGADTAVVAQFGGALSGSPATVRRRTGRISARLGLSHSPHPGPVGDDDERAIGDILAATPVTGWPDGVRGRRDAAVVVLRGRMRLTRSQIRALASSDFRPGLGSISVTGRTVPRAVEPGRCPACAVTRWLRLAADLESTSGWRRLRNDWSGRWPNTAGSETAHDCARRLPGNWREFRVLVPAIDRHGWVSDYRPLSPRAISAITNRPIDRDEAAAMPDPVPAGSPRPPWDRAAQVRDLEYLDPLFDRLENEIDRALDRTRGLLRGA